MGPAPLGAHWRAPAPRPDGCAAEDGVRAARGGRQVLDGLNAQVG